MDAGDWLLITQPDHAGACGVFAERWGSAGGDFAPPEPRDPVVVAAREHDNGWTEWEAAPTMDPEAGRPRHFTEMPVPEYIPIWRRGIRRAADRDLYAGLLVSLHGSHLLRSRHAGGRDGADDREALARFLTEQEGFQAAARQALRAGQAAVPTNFRLLQVWDRLSLLLCCGPISPTPLEGVPARRGALAMKVLPDGDRSAALDPYPFAGGPVELAMPARRIPARPYTTPEVLRAALASAPVETLTFVLHST